MRPCAYPIEWLVPHARPMILIDEVLYWDGSLLKAGLTIRPTMPFFRADKGVPVHVAIEFMAQSCGAFIGMEAMEKGEDVRVGFLLGTRNFAARIPWFVENARLVIVTSVSFRDAEIGVFDCTVDCDGESVAQASLTLHRPSDAGAALSVPRGGAGAMP